MAENIIHLHVYYAKGGVKGIALSEDAKVLNDNQIIKMTHDSKEYRNWLKHVEKSGIIKIEILGILSNESKVRKTSDPDYKGDKAKFEYKKVSKEIDAEIKVALNGNKEIKLTPEQEEIAVLKKQMAELVKSSEMSKTNNLNHAEGEEDKETVNVKASEKK